MKSFKEYLEESRGDAVIELPAAKNDQEIFDRLEKLKKAGIKAFSGARSAHTDILVDPSDEKEAKKILGIK